MKFEFVLFMITVGFEETDRLLIFKFEIGIMFVLGMLLLNEVLGRFFTIKRIEIH